MNNLSLTQVQLGIVEITGRAPQKCGGRWFAQIQPRVIGGLGEGL